MMGNLPAGVTKQECHCNNGALEYEYEIKYRQYLYMLNINYTIELFWQSIECAGTAYKISKASLLERKRWGKGGVVPIYHICLC